MSEADYRPKRRAGYVPSPPRRKIPLIRLLILLAAAVVVYRHFDSYWPRLRLLVRSSSGRTPNPGNAAVNRNSGWNFSGDSTRAFLSRGRAPYSDFCATLESMSAGFCNQTEAVVEKGKWLRMFKAPVISRVEVHFSASETGSSTKVPVLVALEGRDGGRNFRYQRMNTDDPWCDTAGVCLSPKPPRMPVAQGTPSEPVTDEPISRWVSPRAEVFPVLSGRVAKVDSLESGNRRVVLYHGRELYTTYEGLKNLAKGLTRGSSVNPAVSIGEADELDSSSRTESSRYVLMFRVEQAGMSLDPVEFFSARAAKP